MAAFPSKLEVQEDLSLLRNSIIQNNTNVIVSLERKYMQYLPSELFKYGSSLKRDFLSTCILPRDIPSNMVPIKTTGNGDCLFNSFSICLMGNENLSGVLRLLTTVEIFQNSEFYANHCRFNEVETSYSKTSLFVMSLSVDVSNGNNAMECLRQQAIHTCYPGNWSGLIHMMALSSVIKRPVYSVYPESSPAICPFFHGLIRPRNAGSSICNDLVHIMFTRDSMLDNRPGAVFQPNHYCPLFQSGNSNGIAFHESSASFQTSCFVPDVKSIKEFPPLGFENKDKKNDIRCFFKRPKKKTARETVSQTNDKIHSKDENEFISTATSMSNFKTLFSKECVDSKNPSIERFDTLPELSTKYLSQFWYHKQGVACLHKNKHSQWYLSLPGLSRDWYSNASNRNESTPTLENSAELLEFNNEKIFTKNSKLFQENVEVRLTLEVLSSRWYARRGRLAAKNWGRLSRKERGESTGGLKFGSAKGSIDENIKHILSEQSKTTRCKRRSELQGLLAVGETIKSTAIISTQDAGKVYDKAKNGTQNLKNVKKMSSYWFSYFGKYFNIAQFYLNGKAYIMENRNQNFDAIVQQLQNIVESNQNCNNQVIEKQIGDVFKSALQLMDTKRDKDIVKGLFAHATSVKFVSKIQKVQNKSAIMNCRDELKGNIELFKNIQQTSQVVRNDMTNSQQRRLQTRIVQARKDKEMKLKLESRGRMMKAEEWPELCKTMEYIFGELDQKEKSGGGLEAHSRLKNEVMFRSVDNNTFMTQALKIINSLSPPSFNISLSSCYNYTMTYKQNTASAKRHHHGKNVNANISLHRPPKTLVKNLVVNLHYSTANVNYICDSADQDKDNFVVDSKDAKKIVCAEISPVQKPRRTWREIEYPDHDWDQSRTNSVTPMTHLLMNTVITKQEFVPSNPSLNNWDITLPNSDTIVHVTRSGKAVTFLNPSLLEPDTTIRLFNEIFLLLSKPDLDFFFRNRETGRLKSVFVFIVDNGPAEQPSSPLVQMFLIRLLQILDLDKITQVSFAEYHSKRNFVERVHAIEDEVLSRHGPFSANKIFNDRSINPGSEKHIANMEEMVKDVSSCLQQAKFGGKNLEAYRGIKNSDYIFSDEKKQKQFLLLSEEQKEVCDWTYELNKDSLVWRDVEAAWNLSHSEHFTYLKDYKILTNKLEYRTAWIDKYHVTFYRPNNLWVTDQNTRQELQPIPDYVRWITTGGELHYLSHDRILAMKGKWNECPGLFRPDRLLDNLISFNSDPPSYIFPTIAALVWLPENEVKQYYEDQHEKFKAELDDDLEREKWRSHELFEKNVNTLQDMCKKYGLSPKGPKHHLIERIAKSQQEDRPEAGKFGFSYDGNFNELPKSLSLLRKLPKAKLRYILNYHGVPAQGTKEELCLRVLLIKQNRYYLAFKHQEDELGRMLTVVSNIILEQRRMSILNPSDTLKKKDIPDLQKRKIVSASAIAFDTGKHTYGNAETH